jgi:hypothetical protein
MKASDVSFAISKVLSEIGVDDAFVEQAEGITKSVVNFDIQRTNVNGEELWFCFRVVFLVDLQQFDIKTRKDYASGRLEADWRVSSESEETFSFWLRLYILREELTRP